MSSSSFGMNYILNTANKDQKLTLNICKITKDIIISESNTQDILIANFGEKIWSSTINEIVQCVDEEAAVVITKLDTKITGKLLRKAKVVVLVGFDAENHVILDLKESLDILVSNFFRPR
jgi:hypothetical protein